MEDEAIIAMEIESHLKNLGYGISGIVNTAEKAIQKTETERPDLVLMDIRLKGEMDGIEAAQIIRDRFEIPVIFSTAYLDEERIERAKMTIPFGYILKPIQERDLKVTIEMALFVAEIERKRKQAEKVLQDSELKLRTLLETSPIGIQISDLEGRITFSNQAHQNIHELSEEEILGRYLWTFNADEEDAEKEKTGYFNFIKTGSPPQHFGVDISGAGRRYHYMIDRGLLKDSEGKPYAVCSFLSDISDLKKTEEALRASEEKNRRLFENADIGMGYYTLDGTIISFNKMAANHMKGKPEDFEGRSVLDVFGEGIGAVFLQRIKDTCQSTQPLVYEDLVKLPTGEKWFQSIYVRISDDAGTLIGIQVISNDISQQKQKDSTGSN